jgi:hypothetical protein
LQELNSQPTVTQVQAQTSLAKGITANRSGSLVEAMNYFSYAASFDANLLEANQRLDGLTKKIESGNLGENIRNDIQLRNAWKNLLEDAIAFYDANPYVNLVYRTVPELGKINYNSNKAELKFAFWLEPNAGVDAIRKILKALASTEKVDAWGLKNLVQELYHRNSSNTNRYYVEVNAELFDENGIFLAKATGREYLEWLNKYENPGPKTTSIMLEFFDRISFTGTSDQRLVFSVDADKISDQMVIKFPTVRKVYLGSGGSDSFRVNAADNIRILPTDKTFVEYFSKRPQYRNVEENSWGSLRYTYYFM